MQTMIRNLGLCVAIAMMPISAVASDCALEINQACAEQRGPTAGDDPGCFPGDTDGFPVTITATGSYILTSSLSLIGHPNAANTIVIDAYSTSGVHIDLNGHEITGPAFCAGSGFCGGGGTGNGIELGFNGLIKNGGIHAQAGTIIENVHVSSVGGDGIECSWDCLVRDTRVSLIGQAAGTGCCYRHTGAAGSGGIISRTIFGHFAGSGDIFGSPTKGPLTNCSGIVPCP